MANELLTEVIQVKVEPILKMALEEIMKQEGHLKLSPYVRSLLLGIPKVRTKFEELNRRS